MALFSVKVINEVGKEEKRIQEAIDEKNLRVILKEQNLILVKATKLKEKQPNLFFAVSSKVKPEEVILFLRQFSVMVNSSISISDALNALKQQNYTAPFRKVLMDVHNSVISGSLLSEAFATHLEVFPEFFVQMVSIGEASSSLDTVLRSMADYYENNQRMKKKSRTAMVYPMILLVMIAAVVLFLSFVILPQFGELFENFGGDVPKVTQVIMSVAGFIRDQIAYIITGTIFVILSIMLFFTTKVGIRVKDWLKINLPVLGKVNRAILTARFTRAFIILLRSGMNITDCMENLKKILGNEIYAEKFQFAIDEVKRGKKIADSIEKTGIFPKMLTEMITVGEKSGNLEEVLESTTLFFESQVDSAIMRATAALEPAMIIILGIVVVGVLLAVYMPMISMYNAI